MLLISASPAASLCESFAAYTARGPSALDELSERNLALSRDLLEARAGDRAAGSLYAACMDEGAAERAGLEPLQPLLDEVAAIHDRATLTDALADMDNVGVNALWRAAAEANAQGAREVAVVSPPGPPERGERLVPRASLTRLLPSIDWDVYFARRGFARSDEVDLTSPAYLEALETRLRQTPIEDVRAELRASVLRAFSAWLPAADGGTPLRIARWKQCVALVDSELGDALAQLWLARAFPPSARKRADTVVDAMVAEARDAIERASWMSAVTRRSALAQLRSMTRVIGYASEGRPTPAIDPHALVADILRTRAARISVDVATVGEPVDRRHFGLSVLSVNAYYEPARNELVVPAGILQPPLFGNDAADDYGSIGAVIGHELTHAFQRLPGFDAHVACVGRQLPPAEREEAVADLGGLELADRAFKKRGADTGVQAQKRFFLAFARLWSGTSSTEGRRYAPASARVRGTLQNIPEFAQAFGCRAARERCAVW